MAVEDVPVARPANHDLTPRQWAAILIAVCTAFASQMTMPLWIAAAIHHLRISDEVAGRVGALEYTAVATVSLFVGMGLRRLPVRRMMIVGMAIRCRESGLGGG